MAAERRGSRTMEGGKVLGLELRPPQSRDEGDVNLGVGGYSSELPCRPYFINLKSL